MLNQDLVSIVCKVQILDRHMGQKKDHGSIRNRNYFVENIDNVTSESHSYITRVAIVNLSSPLVSAAPKTNAQPHKSHTSQKLSHSTQKEHCDS